jgi:hypothetical protein
MKATGLLIASFVLAALLGVLYWSNHRKPTEDKSIKASADTPVKMLSLNQSDIVHLTIRHKGDPSIDLVRNDSGVWQISAPRAFAADQDDVSSVLSALSSLSSERLLEEKASDLAPYGLIDPGLELDVKLKDNRTQKLLIGDQTPSGNAYYAALAGDPRLFTVAGFYKTGFDRTANDLRDKRLLTADFDKVNQIELLNQKPEKKQEITLARDKDAWQILKPKPYRVDSDRVEDLIRTLRNAKMDLTSATDDAKTTAAFKSAGPFASAKITGASGTQELEIRRMKDDYYVKSSAVSGVYKVSSSIGAELDKSLDDFRNKKLFDFGYQDPNKIEIQDGPKSYSFTHSSSDWWGPDGKKLEEMSTEALVGKLRELSATKFPDSGFSAPMIEITVTSNESKRVEKVSIARRADAYVAKRENEPALYELSGSAVSQLEESVANIKPASATKK